MAYECTNKNINNKRERSTSRSIKSRGRVRRDMIRGRHRSISTVPKYTDHLSVIPLQPGTEMKLENFILESGAELRSDLEANILNVSKLHESFSSK